MDEQEFLNNGKVKLSLQLLQHCKGMFKYSKIVSYLMLGELLLILAFVLWTMVFHNDKAIAFIVVSVIFIPMVKLIAMVTLLLVALLLKAFVGISIYRFSKKVKVGMEERNTEKVEEGLKWLRNTFVGMGISISIFVLLFLLNNTLV